MDILTLECLTGLMFNELMKHLRSLNPLLADVISFGYKGVDRKDIVQMLPVKMSQAYDLYVQAYKLAQEFLSGR